MHDVAMCTFSWFYQQTDEIVTGVNLTWWKAVCETLKKERSEMVMSTPRFE